MRVELVGVHRVKKRLAAGGIAIYYYAWRGGPRIETDPADEHEFMAEYLRLTRDRPDAAPTGCLPDLIRKYRASSDYQDRKPSTLANYDKAIDKIEAAFHTLELSALGERGMRGVFLEWRDTMADTPRSADYTMAVLAKILAFGADREHIDRNPLEKLGKIYEGTRRDEIWTDQQLANFAASASPQLCLALELARWTGQRQGDLLKLTWSAYDGTHIRLRQGKTGREVRFRVYSQLKKVLDAEKERVKALPADKVSAVTILTTSRGTSWTSDGFRASWGTACDKAKISGVTFHDLRGTFISLAYRVHKATFREIAEVSGHSEKDVEAFIRRHYLAGEAVVAKMELGNERAQKL